MALLAVFVVAPVHIASAEPDVSAQLKPTSQPPKVVMGETVYVPVYSHIHLSNAGKRYLAATLSIRNTDRKHPIVVTGARYYDTDGKLVQTFLDSPHALRPLASADFVIDQVDKRGGAGANFIVSWVAGQTVSKPIIEAVMAGVTGTQGIAFVRPGRVIATKP
jgi:hypothetical protein